MRILLFSFLSWLHAFKCRSVSFNLALTVSCLQNVYVGEVIFFGVGEGRMNMNCQSLFFSSLYLLRNWVAVVHWIGHLGLFISLSIQMFNCIYVVEYYFTAGGEGRPSRGREDLVARDLIWWESKCHLLRFCKKELLNSCLYKYHCYQIFRWG